jgi:membrane protein YqaA with SNARE-associated domain
MGVFQVVSTSLGPLKTEAEVWLPRIQEKSCFLMHAIFAKITAFLKTVAPALGGPGLLLIAFLDSSFLSFPEINDLLIIANSYHNPERMIYYATMTLIGSVLGCTALYMVGKRGGSALLKKKFDEGKVRKVQGWYDKYGMLAIIIPSILPPPTPFKIFVLTAGVFDIKLGKFVLSVIIGRSIRYYLEGYLAMTLGEHAADWMKEHYPWVALSMVLTIVSIFIIYWVMRKKHPAGSK